MRPALHPLLVLHCFVFAGCAQGNEAKARQGEAKPAPLVTKPEPEPEPPPPFGVTECAKAIESVEGSVEELRTVFVNTLQSVKIGEEGQASPEDQRRICETKMELTRAKLLKAREFTSDPNLSVDRAQRVWASLTPKLAHTMCRISDEEYPHRAEEHFLVVLGLSGAGQDDNAYKALVELEKLDFDSPWRQRAETCLDPKAVVRARAEALSSTP